MPFSYSHIRKLFILLCICSMLAGLFLPRAFLSVSLIAFISASVLHPHVKQQVRDLVHDRLATGMSILFFLPLLSGLWSNDKAEWSTIMQIKLPLLLLPLAFAGIKDIRREDWLRVALFFIVLTLGGTVWSFADYLQHKAVIDHDYLHSKTLRTPLEDDHVRFSWMVVLSVLFSACILLREKIKPAFVHYLLAAGTAWLLFYLHLLSARTGLIALYAGAGIWMLWLMLYKARRLTALILLLLLFILPLAAYQLLPTFRNRVNYFRYEFSFVKDGNYRPGSNDGIRMASLKAGWDILQRHPLTGAGFGDIRSESENFYRSRYPQLSPGEYIYPSGQYMMYGAGTGWPGLLLYTAVLLLPFFLYSFRSTPQWWILQGITCICLLPDNGLEIQHGVFFYAFVLLWCRHWWRIKTTPDEA